MQQFFMGTPWLFMALSMLVRSVFFVLIAIALILAIRCMLKYLRETPKE